MRATPPDRRLAAVLRTAAKPSRRPGYVLIVVMLVIVVLSLAAYRFADAMTAEYAVAVRSTEAAQAKAFAVSGVYYAAGALADPGTMSGTLANNPTDAASFGNVAVGGSSGPRGGGKFSLFTVGDTFTGTGEGRYAPRFGVTDEGGKLNVNALMQADPTGQVLYDALMKLPNMTEEIADAIVDWLDPDDTDRTSGAESGYYGGLSGAYRAKNGPANTLDELLLVRGVTAQLLYGTDRNRNGRMDAAEADAGDFSLGWSEYLTVYGRELDVDANGEPRIGLADTAADPATLYAELTTAVGQDPADYIMFVMFGGTTASTAPAPTTPTDGSASSGTSTSTTSSSGSGGSSSSTSSTSGGSSGGSNSSSGSTATPTGTMADINAYVQQKLGDGSKLSKPVASVLTLVNSMATVPKTTTGADGKASTANVTVASPLNDPATMKTVLPTLMEATTPRTDYDMPPRVNVNTAPPEVLTALPGLTAEEVTAITTARSSLAADDAARGTGIWLVTAGNLSPSKFQALEQYVTGRSMTYRVQSVGFFEKGGPAARVEAVVDTNLGHPRVVYFRDLTDLGRGFEISR